MVYNSLVLQLSETTNTGTSSLCMMFKIVNNLLPINFNDHLSYCKTVTRRNHPQKLNILAPRKDTYKFSFFFQEPYPNE